jgi:hypothetical protein
VQAGAGEFVFCKPELEKKLELAIADKVGV